MADASPESIQRLIENSEKGLTQIEMSLPLILETRQAIGEAIKKQDERNVGLDLLLVVFDMLLAEHEVIYDLSASLDALLKAKDDYTKRFYMQSLNLCFCEACQLFVGEDGDEDGLLSRLVRLTQELHQAGCEYIVRHIIEDIQSFKKEYVDRELRNITRHYDDPIKMYEMQKKLDNIDFFAKGASELMAIRMEVTVVSTFLLSLLAPNKSVPQNVVSKSRCSLDLKGMLNDALFKALKEKNLKGEVQRTLNNAQAALDECYRLYENSQKVVKFLEERNCQIPDEFNKMELLMRLRMETLFLRYDVACSIWGYLNAASEKEHSQNLRLIHITKQAALTHIYGYNEKAREKSMWAKIVAVEEACDEKLNTVVVEEKLKKLTSNLGIDRVNSNIYAHYRHKQDYYIHARLEAFGKMEHHTELMEAMKLLNVCKSLEAYTVNLLCRINENQKKEKKRQYDEWMAKIDGLTSKAGHDTQMAEVLKPLRELIGMVYGDEKLLGNAWQVK